MAQRPVGPARLPLQDRAEQARPAHLNPLPTSGAGAAFAKAPHPLQVVERAHFGAEQVDDNAARIHQHPVRCGQAFDTRVAVAAVFQTLGELLCDGGHLPAGTAGCDHHEIGDARFALEVDGHDVLGLVVIERLQHGCEQRVLRSGQKRVATCLLGRGRGAGLDRLYVCLWHLSGCQLLCGDTRRRPGPSSPICWRHV